MDINTTKKSLEHLEKDELIKIITNLSNYSDQTEAWLLDYCRKNGKGENENLIAINELNHYWEVASEIDEYDETYDEIEAEEALTMMNELVKNTKIDWDVRRSILDEMLEHVCYGNSDYADSLIESCLAFCQGKEEELYLAKALDKKEFYWSHIAATIYLKYGDKDKYVAIKANNLQYGSDYIELANYYKAENQLTKAIELVEEALDKDCGFVDQVYNWLFKEYVLLNQEDKMTKMVKKALTKKQALDTLYELMIQYYANDYENKKVYLIKMLEVCNSRHLRQWFDECKSFLSASDFANHSAKLYEKFKERNLHDYLQLRIDEGYYEEVYLALKANPNNYYGVNVDLNHNLSKQLIAIYPKEIYEQYWIECEYLCSTIVKDNYLKAIELLLTTRSISEDHGFSERWEAKFSALLKEHKRKRKLMEYINAEKGLQLLDRH